MLLFEGQICDDFQYLATNLGFETSESYGAGFFSSSFELIMDTNYYVDLSHYLLKIPGYLGS